MAYYHDLVTQSSWEELVWLTRRGVDGHRVGEVVKEYTLQDSLEQLDEFSPNHAKRRSSI